MNHGLTLEEVEQLADRMDGWSLEHILCWAFEHFGDQVGMMTALGYSGVVLMDHVRKIRPGFEVVFVDTGFHFPQTLAFLEDLQQRWELNFNVVQPSLPREQIDSILGPQPWKTNPDLCCHHRKVEPMLRMLPTKAAWLSALRRDQSTSRARLEVVEIDGRGTLKIYPMARWTRDQTWDYIRDNQLPYHPLHDENYPSIGCTHCTAPVAPGQHERAGRWNSMPKLECGIHVHRDRQREA